MENIRVHMRLQQDLQHFGETMVRRVHLERGRLHRKHPVAHRLASVCSSVAAWMVLGHPAAHGSAQRRVPQEVPVRTSVDDSR